jgi:hypothetical protein
MFGPQMACPIRHRLRAGSISASFDLLNQRPAGKQIIEHGRASKQMPEELKAQMILAATQMLVRRGPTTAQ